MTKAGLCQRRLSDNFTTWLQEMGRISRFPTLKGEKDWLQVQLTAGSSRADCAQQLHELLSSVADQEAQLQKKGQLPAVSLPMKAEMLEGIAAAAAQLPADHEVYTMLDQCTGRG